MRVLLLDTNIVSILFKPDYPLHRTCLDIVAGDESLISFMSRSELLLWPIQNQWGSPRRMALEKHIDRCTTLFPDDDTCLIWAGIMAESRTAGRPMSVADAWVAAAARQ